METNKHLLLPTIKTTLSFTKSRCDSSSLDCNSNQFSPSCLYEAHGYTSLKDIILSSSPQNAANNGGCDGGGSMIFSSNISIRNELVKHAASAYVQSAASMLVLNRDQEGLSSLWERIRNHFEDPSHSCWYIYVSAPLHALFRPVFRILGYICC